MKAFLNNSQPHSIIFLTHDSGYFESLQAFRHWDFTLFAYPSRLQNFGWLRILATQTVVRIHSLHQSVVQRTPVLASPESSLEMQILRLWLPKTYWTWLFPVSRSPGHSMHVEVWEPLTSTSPLDKCMHFLCTTMNLRIFLQTGVGLGCLEDSTSVSSFHDLPEPLPPTISCFGEISDDMFPSHLAGSHGRHMGTSKIVQSPVDIRAGH